MHQVLYALDVWKKLLFYNLVIKQQCCFYNKECDTPYGPCEEKNTLDTMKNCVIIVCYCLFLSVTRKERVGSSWYLKSKFLYDYETMRETFFELYGRLLHQTTGEDAEIMAV